MGASGAVELGSLANAFLSPAHAVRPGVRPRPPDARREPPESEATRYDGENSSSSSNNSGGGGGGGIRRLRMRRAGGGGLQPERIGFEDTTDHGPFVTSARPGLGSSSVGNDPHSPPPVTPRRLQAAASAPKTQPRTKRERSKRKRKRDLARATYEVGGQRYAVQTLEKELPLTKATLPRLGGRLKSTVDSMVAGGEHDGSRRAGASLATAWGPGSKPRLVEELETFLRVH